MGRREADSGGAANDRDRSELGCLQHAASEEAPRLRSSVDQRQGDMDAVEPILAATAPAEVKKHQHKHNLKHRYEVMETLGKGAYGKVKKAVEKTSLRTVSEQDGKSHEDFYRLYD